MSFGDVIDNMIRKEVMALAEYKQLIHDAKGKQEGRIIMEAPNFMRMHVKD